MKAQFIQALPVLEKLEAAGFEAYFVGGAVRDFLLGRKISDVDIATSAFPEEVKTIFARTYDTGIKHGTVTVSEGGEHYEVTTFRTEGTYTDFRRPEEVTFIRSLKEDLLRRDFTMNAIAMDRHFAFHDPFQGQEAIKAKSITAVGDPKARFHEDALRMMRAVRFLSQLDFTLEEKTARALAEEISLLAHVSVERVTVEWLKLHRGKAFSRAVQMIAEVGMEAYLPGLSGKKTALFELSSWTLPEAASDELLWLLLMVATKPADVKTALKAWRLPNRTIKQVAAAYAFLMDEEQWTKWHLYQAGRALFTLIEDGRLVVTGQNEYAACLLAYEALPIHSRSELQVTGHDLLAWSGKSGGPWLSETLLRVEQAVVDGRLPNEKPEIRRWLGYGENES
ncbi:CCA tRNA nucleotidyltransferase [Listeria costaricensis]|uniref:CCA tRNA nucleotidyltransferase n=1 Tax=Listeria costaricensis TaxID=2026604 RepID=UPI000C0693A3|nr:CCA tRNA nucleotidyltransferase [Listeria costaricensis]